MLRKLTFSSILQSFSSALLLVLSYPGWNFELLAWISFVPLFFSLNTTSWKKAFVYAYLAGLLFWSISIYWLVHVTGLGLFLLVLYLALYFGAFGLITRRLFRSHPVIQALCIPAAWVALEYMRAHLLSGFPWALLGYSQYLNLPAIQIADIAGPWAVSFLVMSVNVGCWQAARYLMHKDTDTRGVLFPAVALPLVLMLVSCGYGLIRLHSVTQPESGERIRVSVLQANIPQELKWNPRARDAIVDRYLALSNAAAGDLPQLLIWPEAALPVIPEEEPAVFGRVMRFSEERRLPLLLGAVTERNGYYYNSALLLPAGQRYDKLHLVPFGEFIPLRHILRFLETIAPIGDIEKGGEYTIFALPFPGPKTAHFAVLICFEDLFPELARAFVGRGAGFLVNITNDAWYKKTSAAHQHFQASVFRAVENRVWVVRAANTGVSGFIAPSGRKVSLVRDETGREIFVEGYRCEEVSAGKKNPTFYSRIGDGFALACIFLALYGIIRPSKKKGAPAAMLR